MTIISIDTFSSWGRLVLLIFIVQQLRHTDCLVEGVGRSVSVFFPGAEKTGTFTEPTTLEYTGVVPQMSSFTVCFRMQLLKTTAYDPIISYAVDGNPNELSIGMVSKRQVMTVLYFKEAARLDISFPYTSSYIENVCLALDFTSGNWTLVKNQKIIRGSLSSNASTIESGGSLKLGKNFFGTQFLAGTLADFRLYHIVLPDFQMVSFASCDALEISYDPIISFQAIHELFISTGIQVTESESSSHFCFETKPFDLIMIRKRDFSDAINDCQRLGGQLKVPLNVEDNSLLSNLSLPYESFCRQGKISGIWLGIKRHTNAQEECHPWYAHHLNKAITYSRFANISTGNCLNYRKCSVMLISSIDDKKPGDWMSAFCEETFCTACYFTEGQRVRIRGLCSEFQIDSLYLLSSRNGSVELIGNNGNRIVRIELETNQENWVIMNSDNHKQLAWTSTPHLFGINEWHHGSFCGKNSTKLLITLCKKHQYTCNDGRCIDIAQRCNQRVDCRDGSDEEDCHFIVFPKKYMSHIPPPGDNSSHVPTVKMIIRILNVQDTATSESMFSVVAIFILRWTDNRLQFKNLKNDIALNKVTGYENKVWLPVFFVLGENYTPTNMAKNDENLWISRESKPTEDTGKYLHEDKFYDGRDNILVWSTKFSMTVYCEFDLFGFPFDIQHCTMDVEMVGMPRDIIKLEATNSDLFFHGSRNLRKYRLENWTLSQFVNNNEGKFSSNEYRINLTFTNHVNYFFVSTIIPTFIIAIIAYLTFYFPIEDFNERIMVALTALLVEAAFFTQTAETIPKTAYVKVVDLWFCLCIWGLFLMIILLVIINYKFHKENTVNSLPPKELHARRNIVTSYGNLWTKSVAPSMSPVRCNTNRKHRLHKHIMCFINLTPKKINLMARIFFPVITFVLVVVFTVLIVYSRENPQIHPKN